MRNLPLVVLGASLCSLSVYAEPAKNFGTSTVFTRANVVDVASGRVHLNTTVIVIGERIAEVSKDGEARIPRDASVIDGSGKFLIPGLWDMHVHIFFGEVAPAAREITLPLLIANGITGVRDMGSDLESILRMRRDVSGHAMVCPRMVIAGPMLVGPKDEYPASIRISTPDEGRRTVGMLKGRGVDFIKIQSSVPRDAFFAIADECRKHRIVFSGHVPDTVRASEAIKAAMKSFEHLTGVFEGSSSLEGELLKGPKGPGRFLDTYDAAIEASLIRSLKKNRVWQCPTFYWESLGLLIDVANVSHDPAAKYVPLSWSRTLWPKWTASIMKNSTKDPLPVRERFFKHEMGILNRLRSAGVMFLAGTDAPGGVNLIPGVSLHRELQWLVTAGFTPIEALRAATINAAKFLGKLNDLGSIEKGRMADLVLLDANPLTDIRNTERVAGVMLGGRHFSRDELDRILMQVESNARKF